MKTNEEQISAIEKILGKQKKKNHNGRLKARKVDRYLWTIQDEQLAIELYQKNASNEDIKEAIKGTDIKYNSMKMKIKNVEFLDTGKGLENSSESLKILYNNANKSLTSIK